MKRIWSKSSIVMDTVVTIQGVSETMSDSEASDVIDEAIDAFYQVERVSSRFDHDSELMQLLQRVGEPVHVSQMLFEQIRFALTIATMTDGAFDPTIGHVLHNLGFNRNYLTGDEVEAPTADTSVTYRDIKLDEDASTVFLTYPTILDLGAVAKGFAADLAVRSLTAFDGCCVDAGGDIVVSGANVESEPWRIGIRHPVNQDKLWCTLTIPDGASVCTSGSYVRRSPNSPTQHHIVHPSSGTSSGELLSCTVVAPFAMMADALSTAAFVLGPQRGAELLEACDVDALFVTSNLEQYTTQGMKRCLCG